MIITRTPFRVSFAEVGRPDLPAFYEKHGGCVLSTGIDANICTCQVHIAKEETILKYSKTEIVDDVKKIEHLYFKNILQRLDIQGVEITSTADIPAGTGLGSSSSFTVGLLHSLYSYKGKFVSKNSYFKSL